MPDDKPGVARIKRIPHSFDFGKDRNNKLAPLIVDVVHRMTVSERRAASGYQTAVARLRADKTEAVRLVSNAYRSLKPDKSMDRWSLIHLASELNEPSALGLFQNVLRTPPPKDSAPCGRGQASEESILQATALEGVRRLAESGDSGAQKILEESTTHPNRTVKRAAIQALLASGGPRARAKLLKSLPKADHFWLDVRSLPANEVRFPSVPKVDRGKPMVQRPGLTLPKIGGKE